MRENEALLQNPSMPAIPLLPVHPNTSVGTFPPGNRPKCFSHTSATETPTTCLRERGSKIGNQVYTLIDAAMPIMSAEEPTFSLGEHVTRLFPKRCA